jgi:type I restriction enzyme S subunit
MDSTTAHKEISMRTENGFKETEVGPIPVDWEVVRLGDLIHRNHLLVQNGFPCGEHNQQGKGVPHLRPFNVDNDGQINLETVKYIGPDKDLDKYFLRNGDVLFNNTNSEELVGKTAYWDKTGTFVLSNHMTILRVLDSDTLDPYFLARYLYKRWLEGYLQSLCRRHVNQASISLARLEQIPIPLPPLPEQRRIAHVLNTIQREIAAQDALIAAAREVKRSLMQRLFTYGPGAEPAPTNETEFGRAPEHWKVMPLDECAFVQTGVTKGRNLGNTGVISVPYLRVANVQDGYLTLSEIKDIRIRASELERYKLQVGDVVLTEGGDFDKLGRGFIWQGEIPVCIHQNHIFAVRTRRDTLLPNYLGYLVQSDYGKAYFLKVAHRTTNLASINSTKLKAFPALVPDLREQECIAGILATADRKIATEEQRKAALQALFKSMLQQLMTGQIRV